jgi:hypothetical protein
VPKQNNINTCINCVAHTLNEDVLNQLKKLFIGNGGDLLLGEWILSFTVNISRL